MKNVVCKVCGENLDLSIKNRYTSRDNVDSGMATVFSQKEELQYDTFDCVFCGCQNVMQERKRTVVIFDMTEDCEDEATVEEEVEPKACIQPKAKQRDFTESKITTTGWCGSYDFRKLESLNDKEMRKLTLVVAKELGLKDEDFSHYKKEYSRTFYINELKKILDKDGDEQRVERSMKVKDLWPLICKHSKFNCTESDVPESNIKWTRVGEF